MRQLGGIAVNTTTPKLTHGAEWCPMPAEPGDWRKKSERGSGFFGRLVQFRCEDAGERFDGGFGEHLPSRMELRETVRER